MQSSKRSGTDAGSKPSAVSSQHSEKKLVAACNATADELAETRKLVAALDTENIALRERLETERQISATNEKLSAVRESEMAALRAAITAKDETIAAKNALLENREQMITELKNKPRSPLKRLGDILLGAAVIAVLK